MWIASLIFMVSLLLSFSRTLTPSQLNFPQSTTLCWDLQIETLLEIQFLETLDLSTTQHLPTDDETSWSWNFLGYNFLGECSWGFKLSYIELYLHVWIYIYETKHVMKIDIQTSRQIFRVLYTTLSQWLELRKGNVYPKALVWCLAISCSIIFTFSQPSSSIDQYNCTSMFRLSIHSPILHPQWDNLHFCNSYTL